MLSFGLHLHEKQSYIYAHCSLGNAKSNLKLLKGNNKTPKTQYKQTF